MQLRSSSRRNTAWGDVKVRLPSTRPEELAERLVGQPLEAAWCDRDGLDGQELLGNLQRRLVQCAQVGRLADPKVGIAGLASQRASNSRCE